MHTQDGRAHVLVHPNAITIITQSLKTSVAKTKILGLKNTKYVYETTILYLKYTLHMGGGIVMVYVCSFRDCWSSLPGAWRTQESIDSHGPLPEVCCRADSISGD